jgi:hypothetical protein
VLPVRFNASYSYQCQFGAANNPWQLLILGDNFGKSEFQLYDQQGKQYQLLAYHQDMIPLPDRTFRGFQIADGNNMVAAVSLANPGRVWVANFLPQDTQAQLVQAATNLWLYQYGFENPNRSN